MKEEFLFGEIKRVASFAIKALKKVLIPIVLITLLGGVLGYYFKPDGSYVSKALLSNGVAMENPYLTKHFSVNPDHASVSFDEIKTLFTSKKLLEKTLLTECKVDEKIDLLINHIIHKSDFSEISSITSNTPEFNKKNSLNKVNEVLLKSLDIYEKKGGFTVIEFIHDNQSISVMTVEQLVSCGLSFLTDDYLPNYQSTIQHLHTRALALKAELIELSEKEKIIYSDRLEQKRIEKEYFQIQDQLSFFKSKKIGLTSPVRLIDRPDQLVKYKVYPTWLIISLYSCFSFFFAWSFFAVVFLFTKQLYNGKNVTL